MVVVVVVAYEILVSAQGPLVFGFWVWGLGVRGLGLTILRFWAILYIQRISQVDYLF